MSQEPKRYPRLKRSDILYPESQESTIGGGEQEKEVEAMGKSEEGKEGKEQRRASPEAIPHSPALPPKGQLRVSPASSPAPELSPLYRGGPQKPMSNMIPPDLEAPPTEKQADKAISLMLARAQALALQRVEYLLQKIDQLPVDVLMDVVAKLADLRLTVEWTKRLEHAIESNPSKLIPTGSGARTPLLARLKALATRRQQEAKSDGRLSGEKARRTGTEHNFPQD